MNDQHLNDRHLDELFHDAAEDIEPTDRLAAIRAATDTQPHRGRGWWAVGGASLAAAAAVAAFALTSPSTPTEPIGPAGQSSAPESTGASVVSAVYYVGDTPAGQRLFREFHQDAPSDPLQAAIRGLATPPHDADYVSLWPSDAITRLESNDQTITVDLDPTYADRPTELTPAQAELAIEQAVRTLRAAAQQDVAIAFTIDGAPADQVLGVTLSGPVTPAPDLDVLSHVNLSDPFEGQVVDNDDPFVVKGLGNGYEGNVVTRIQRWEGTEVMDEKPATAGSMGDKLFPFKVTFDLSDVPPGDYVVISQNEDPSGAGQVDTDSRRITVVD